MQGFGEGCVSGKGKSKVYILVAISQHFASRGVVVVVQ
jgi:hypothetical protein